MLARVPCHTGAVDTCSQRLTDARLYLVCDDPSDAFLDTVLGAGVQIVQLRMKDADDEHILEAASRVARACESHQALFILNDRPDLVDAAGADGVHVGQDDGSVALARSLVGENRLVGLSTHSPAQVDEVADLDVDYIGVGPVYETPTKPGRPAVGLELVRHAAAHAAVPFFAIGGISPGNVAAVGGAGGRRVAVVRALTQAGDPALATRELLHALRDPEPRHSGAGVGTT
jgi:thiamine-phosphate pyrophosphorylase